VAKVAKLADTQGAQRRKRRPQQGVEARAMNYRLYNRDCIAGARDDLDNRSVDLLICDLPFGLDIDDTAYNRDPRHVLPGYAEAPRDYDRWTYDWLREARRVLKPDGSIYVITGWTRLRSVLNALHDLDMPLINHII
jgi:site-specific DNA-methyltransferase (adenine-specific)